MRAHANGGGTTPYPGDITADELGNVMKELGLNPSQEELQDLINEVDINKDGVISFDGAVYRLSSPTHSPPTALSAFIPKAGH
jgi:Ca2+-binding EF-hand superfamily protein